MVINFKMNSNTGVHTIAFRHSAEDGEYCNNFSSSSDVYEVKLRQFGNTDTTVLKNIQATTSQRPMSTSPVIILSVKWKKFSRKYIRFKVFEENTSKVLMKEKSFKRISLEMKISFIALINTPAVYVIKILTYPILPSLLPPFLNLKKGTPLLEHPLKEVGEAKLNQLSLDFEHLLNNRTFSDVILTDGVSKLHAHKLILSARSTVFAKMFQHPMQENQKGLVEITDIPFEIVRVLVQYMYSGRVNIKCMKMARELFITADKYDVQSLKKVCLTYLKSLSVEHVLENLLLADLYGVETLKESSLNFIAANYPKVKVLENWSEVKTQNPCLALEILSYVLDKTEL